MKRTFLVVAIAAMALSTVPASASSLVWRPINPAFGGDPLNGSWLFSQGSAQAEGGGNPGFTIDFPDFGGIPQTDPDLINLPEVPGGGTT